MLAAVAALLILVLLYRVLRWALGRVGAAMAHPRERLALGVLAAAMAMFWVGQRVSATFPERPRFSAPVTQTYVRQVRLMAATLGRSTALPPSPPMNSDLSLVKGADVFLFFIEAYGAISYERPEFAARLAADRARLEAAIHDTNRDVVSAYVESPTFGGSSWLAHITLLSGVEIRSHDTNALLMTEKRDTLVTAFKQHGYRTVAVMPGLWQNWPEGAFYGFDEIYGGARLDYQGPTFGWWDMTDQFVLARMDALEVQPRTPRAAVRLFPDDQHAHSVHAHAAVPAGLDARADQRSLRRGGGEPRVPAPARLDGPRAQLRRRAGLHVPVVDRLPASAGGSRLRA